MAETRVHTARAPKIAIEHATEQRLIDLYGDEFEGVGPSLIIEDPGNLEAWVICGAPGEIASFARDLFDRLPAPTLDELTESERAALSYFADISAGDLENISLSRQFDGRIFAYSESEAWTYDLTNNRTPEAFDD